MLKKFKYMMLYRAETISFHYNCNAQFIAQALVS